MKMKSNASILTQIMLALGVVFISYPSTELFADHKPGHGKGGGGGGDGDGGAPPVLGRADFLTAPEFNIVDDGQASCFAGDHPWEDGAWDYWDLRDTVDCPLEDESLYVSQSDFSDGGRWIFDTGYHSNLWQRYLVFHWQPADADSPGDPQMDKWLAPDLEDTTYGVDNLRVRINADSLFKVGFDRQILDIDLWRSIEGQIGRPYVLRYKEPLYIIRDPSNPDVVHLTTEGDPELGLPDVHEAELINNEAKGKNNPDRLVGTYEMPLTIIVRRVTAP